VSRFDALTLSLAELALNALFALLFLLAAYSALPQDSVAERPESGGEGLQLAVRELAAERQALAGRLDASRAEEARQSRVLDELRRRRAAGLELDPRPSCAGALFAGTVVSAGTIRVDGTELAIADLEQRFPGSDRRVKEGCVHEIRVRFGLADEDARSRALRALEDRYRVHRQGS